MCLHNKFLPPAWPSFVAENITWEFTPFFSWPLQETNGSPISYVSDGFTLALHPPRCEPPYSVTITKTGLLSTCLGVAETRFDAHRYNFPLEGPWVKHFPLLKSHFVICEHNDWGLGLTSVDTALA